jgi:DNA-binding transcriptional LysR family regulator
MGAHVAAVRAGAGLGILPHFLGRQHPDLHQVPSGGSLSMRRELWLLLHRDLRGVPRVRATVDCLATRIEQDAPALLGDNASGPA